MPSTPPPLIEPIADGGLRLLCPAKINLALSVGSPQSDGLHPIASWMVPIAFGDTLTLRRGEGPSQFAVNFAEDAPQRREVDWHLTSDLAYRAWQAVRHHVGKPLPVSARLEKRVPAGAGLGGGSADAAGMIDGLNTLFALGLDRGAMLGLAGTLGSDVVFQLSSRLQPGGALVTGTGEAIAKLPPAQPTPILLLLPPFGCPTGAVYGAFDRMLAGDERHADAAGVVALASQPVHRDTKLFNDLAQPAVATQPALAGVLEAARKAGLTPHVTGSGAAVFGVMGPSDMRDLAKRRHELAQATGCAVVLTQTAG